MIADGDPRQRQRARLLADGDEREVGRAAADVARPESGRRREPARASRPGRVRRATRRTRPAAPRADARPPRPASRAARSVSSRASSSNDAGTVTSTSCVSERRVAGHLERAFHVRAEMPEIGGRGFYRRQPGDLVRRPHPAAGWRRCGRRADATATTWPTPPTAPGSRRRAAARARRRRTAAPGPMAGSCCRQESRSGPARRETKAGARRSESRPGRRAAGRSALPGQLLRRLPYRSPPARSSSCRDRCRS